MATGRVLQFDPARGYGFVAADDGGEDVFLHASVFDGDPYVLAPGKKVTFQVMASDRGRKAFAVQLTADEPDPHDKPAQPVPSVPASPAPPVPVPPTAATLASAPETQMHPISGEEQTCDVLSRPEFGQELTELLLKAVPGLTGQQILQARQGVLEFAKTHGWIDG